MRAYSEDLRERVVRAVLIGTPQEDVAARFALSMPTIERWLRLKRETGGLASKPAPGSVPVKTVGLDATPPERLARHNDATLAEHCAWWQERSCFAVSQATMCRALQRIGWTRKTKR